MTPDWIKRKQEELAEGKCGKSIISPCKVHTNEVIDSARRYWFNLGFQSALKIVEEVGLVEALGEAKHTIICMHAGHCAGKCRYCLAAKEVCKALNRWQNGPKEDGDLGGTICKHGSTEPFLCSLCKKELEEDGKGE